MPPSGARRRCLQILACSILLVLSLEIRSQQIHPIEARAHFYDAIHELSRRNSLDLTTEHRLRDALSPGFLVPKGSLLNQRRAENRITRYLQEGKLGLESHGEALEILSRPRRPYDSATRELLSRQLVESFSSTIRRLSVVAEIGNGTSRDLDHTHLGQYLKNNLHLRDHAQVQDSFDSTQPAHIVTLKNDTMLLRIYGGDSKPVGRYYFCCLWSTDPLASKDNSLAWTTLLGSRWSDASKLATPPGNLRERLVLVTVPAGTRVIVGTVADNFVNENGIARPGGNTQIFIPEVTTSLFQEYRMEPITPHLKGTTFPASEILVVTDDGLVRFRPKAGP